MPFQTLQVNRVYPGQPVSMNLGRRTRKCCLERHNKLEFSRKLPSGAQGDTVVLRNQNAQQWVVCKTMRHVDVDYYIGMGEAEPVEVKILRDFLPENDRIMKLLDYSVDIHGIKFFYEYYQGGDVFGLIETFAQDGTDIPELIIWECFKQMCEALTFLHFGKVNGSAHLPSHWRPIMHRDIKPDNILLRAPVKPGIRSTNPSFVLADFGFATTMVDLADKGTVNFLAPELPPRSVKADVWSLGATIHAMAHDGQGPIKTPRSAIANDDNLYDHFARQTHNKLPRSLAGKYSLELELLMFKAFELDPVKRISSMMLLNDIEREFGPTGHVRSLQRPDTR